MKTSSCNVETLMMERLLRKEKMNHKISEKPFISKRQIKSWTYIKIKTHTKDQKTTEKKIILKLNDLMFEDPTLEKLEH